MPFSPNMERAFCFYIYTASKALLAKRLRDKTTTIWGFLVFLTKRKKKI